MSHSPTFTQRRQPTTWSATHSTNGQAVDRRPTTDVRQPTTDDRQNRSLSYIGIRTGYASRLKG